VGQTLKSLCLILPGVNLPRYTVCNRQEKNNQKMRPFPGRIPLSVTIFHSRGISIHGRMARGGHGLPQVSLRPAMADPSTPSERATCDCLQPPWTPHAVRLRISSLASS
jgi:hypothetical protein